MHLKIQIGRIGTRRDSEVVAYRVADCAPSRRVGIWYGTGETRAAESRCRPEEAGHTLYNYLDNYLED
jgi:hypothetical protein